MTQDDIDALKASGLNPIVIDENFDFSQLSAMLDGLLDTPKETNEQVVVRPEED